MSSSKALLIQEQVRLAGLMLRLQESKLRETWKAISGQVSEVPVVGRSIQTYMYLRMPVPIAGMGSCEEPTESSSSIITCMRVPSASNRQAIAYWAAARYYTSPVDDKSRV